MFHDQIVRHGSVAIAVRDYGGHGSPVLLLHGGTRNLGDWATIAPRLAAQHRVVALDFRSHGASTPCEGVWTVADAIDDLQAVITTLHLEHPWLVGHSIGGMVATGYAAEREACRGVVNIDGVGVSVPSVLPGPNPAATRQELQAMIAEMAELIDATRATSPPLLTANEVAQRLSPLRETPAASGGTWDTTYQTAERSWYRREDGRYQENPSAAAVVALSQTVADLDIFVLTRKVRCPLLFIGAVEPAATASSEAPDLMQRWREGVRLTFEQIAREHPNVVWRGIAGDHMLVPRQAAAVANVVLNFLGQEQR